MGEYIANRLGCTMAEARIIQKGFFRDHGTTLAGLMKEHGVEPRDFLDYVHDIDFARLTADPRVVAALDRPPGRKVGFTNGAAAQARRGRAAPPPARGAGAPPARLPGRKLVFTNGDEAYARRVLDRLGLANAFDAVHDIHAMDYVPKPDPRAYAAMCERHVIAPERALF